MTDSAQAPATFAVPDDAEVEQTGGRGSFVSKVQWQHPDGSTATWESRQARKRGFIEVLRDGVVERIRTRPAHAIRLGRCNTVSGISVLLGGVLSQLDAASAGTINWTFLVGGFFFSTGAYAALVQEINSPRGIDKDGALHENRWRWWSYEPS